jgi:hypothetical protein
MPAGRGSRGEAHVALPRGRGPRPGPRRTQGGYGPRRRTVVALSGGGGAVGACATGRCGRSGSRCRRRSRCRVRCRVRCRSRDRSSGRPLPPAGCGPAAGPGEAGQLDLHQGQYVGQAQPQGVGGSGENLGRGLLAPPFDLGEIGHRDPGRLGHVLERALLSEALAAQHSADDMPQERLPGRLHRRFGDGHLGGGRAQWNDAGSVGRVAAHHFRLEAPRRGGRGRRAVPPPAKRADGRTQLAGPRRRGRALRIDLAVASRSSIKA